MQARNIPGEVRTKDKGIRLWNGSGRWISCLVLTWMLCTPAAWAAPRTISIHLDPIKGALRDASLPKGGCNQCHTFGSDQPQRPGSLWTENNNTLCYQCHAGWTLKGIYTGQQDYEFSTHNRDSRMVWPGPKPEARKELDAAGKCVNCHDPHGVEDAKGLIPGLIFLRDDKLCLTCHNGTRSTISITDELRKPYRHPVGRSSTRHQPDEGDQAYLYGISNRHVTCSDCHNGHSLLADPSPPSAPNVSNRNIRVSGVKVINGGAGAIPSYIYRSALDKSTTLAEYEICFKCHSSWTIQPGGQTDLARFLNPHNPSYHPVEAAGKDPLMPDTAFVNGWNARKMTYCGDCHGSDNPNIRGPHGSLFARLLRANYPASAQNRTVTQDELCFRCHNYQTYADPLGGAAAQGGSRWNPPADLNGHAFHVGDQRVPCYACHDSHGSLSNRALIRTGRKPGLRSFSQNASGGNCTATCHTSRSYTLNYPR